MGSIWEILTIQLGLNGLNDNHQNGLNMRANS